MKLYELADCVELQSANKIIIRYYNYDKMVNVDLVAQKYDFKIDEVDEKYRLAEVKYIYSERDRITDRANLVIELDKDTITD